MKTFITVLFGMLLHSQMAQAAIIKCSYQEEACDEAGNHYFCRLFAWGNAEFCSETDRSTHRKQAMDLDFSTEETNEGHEDF